MPSTIGYFISLLYAPLAGLLGDFYFGRHKFLHYSFLLSWAGVVVSMCALLMEYIYPSTVTALNYGVLVPACIVITVGLVGFQVVSIPFGVDQMPGGSTEEISAFIHWLVWAQFLGQVIGLLSFSCVHYDHSVLLIALTAAFSLTVVLCTNYLRKSWFIVEPRCQNPVKTVASVLRYAVKHKYPVRRSAYTYWEEDMPSRIDLGKTKYGGPFTNEQVEDVKTLFRVIIVTACIVAFVMPAEATLVAINPYHYDVDVSIPCNASFVLHVLIVAVLCIPLYEVLVYPFARNWIPSSLKKVAFFAFLTIASSIYLMMLDIIGQSQSEDTVPCMFLANETTPLPTSYLAVAIPVAVLLGVQLLAFNIAAYEFICAQSPYHMKGLITGFGVMIINLAACLGDTMYWLWLYNWRDNSSDISCGTWYYLFTMVIGFVGLALLVIVIRWYKHRERDDIVDEQRFSETYFSTASGEQ